MSFWKKRSKPVWAMLAMLMALVAHGVFPVSHARVLGGVWSAALAQSDPFEIPLASLKRKAPEHVVRFTLEKLSTSDGAPRAVVRLSTRDGFKIYDKGLEFTYRDASGVVSTALAFTPSPKPQRVVDPFYNEERDVHSARSAFEVTLPPNTLPASLADGFVVVRFEACSVSMCLLPTRYDVPILEGARGKPQRKKDGNIGLDAGVSAESQQSRVVKSEDVSLLGGEGDAFAPVDGAPAPSARPTALPKPEPTLMGAALTKPEPTPMGAALLLNESQSVPSTPSVESVTDQASLWVQRSLSARSWLLFPALFLAGLLMNLTPCVYPMIPITLNVLSQFGAHGPANDEQRRRRRALLPFVYVAGMVLAYSLMGVVAAMTGSIFGSLLQNVYVTVVLALVMFLLGLSMLGVFNMSALQTFASKIPVAEKHPALGVLTMGALSGLVSAPCTGPVLSTILLLIGQSRDPLYGFILMLFFSLGFGAPYVVLGLFTQKMGRLPKAGGVLNSVKFVFAALMFALALYYLKPLLGRFEMARWLFVRPGFAGVSIAVLAALVFHLYGRLQPEAARYARAGTLVALTALALWLTLFVTSGFVAPPTPRAVGQAGGGGPLSSSSAPSSNPGGPSANVSNGSDVKWVSDWQQAVVRAKVERKPMMVDAWAEWCVACLKMDETVWKDSEVVKILNRDFIPVKLDFTRSSPFSESIIERWDLSGLPAVGFFPVGADLEAAPPVLFREAISARKFLDTAAPLLASESSQ
ncbi:MAG: thioredoxin family protein [Silvanigrellales bacterium]|nr:thioredoxin family protein [Silvanigrellales bacterium]